MTTDLVQRLRARAAIRRQIATRKSVQEGKPDRLADLLEEAATEVERLLYFIGGYQKLLDVAQDARRTMDDLAALKKELDLF